MNKNTRIMFLRNRNNHTIGCVAMQLSPRGKTVKYQVSTVNPVDKFDRNLAKHIALGRLVDEPVVLKSDEPLSMSDLAYAVMHDVFRNKELPTRARKSARRWLARG